MGYSDYGKVDELMRNVDRLADDVKRWQYRQEKGYSISIEALKNRVDVMASELENISSRLTNNGGTKKFVSQSPTETANIPVLEHLAFRVSQLEKWVTQIDDKFRKNSSIATKQFLISLITLIAVALLVGMNIWFQLGS